MALLFQTLVTLPMLLLKCNAQVQSSTTQIISTPLDSISLEYANLTSTAETPLEALSSAQTSSEAETYTSAISEESGEAYDFTLEENGVICARLKLIGSLDVLYKTKDNEVVEMVTSVPPNAMVSGRCRTKRTVVVLRWFAGNVSLTFYLNTNVNSWTLTEVEVKIDLSLDMFRHPVGDGVHEVKSRQTEPLSRKIQMEKSYLCTNGTYELDEYTESGDMKTENFEAVLLTFEFIQIQPFKAPGDGLFGEAVNCTKTEEEELIPESALPAVVAILISIFVFIMIASYSIHKRYNKRVPYVPM